MSNKNTFANREVANLLFSDYATGKQVHYMDYANTTTNGLTGESVFAYGGWGHPKRVGFNGDRGGTISFETQISTMELYALVTGGTLSSAAKYVKREEVKGGSGTLTISEAADGGSVQVFKASDEFGTEVEGATVSGTTVTAEGITADTDYVVYYTVSKTSGVKSFKLKSTSFPKELRIQGHTLVKGEDGVERDFLMICYKALPQANFDMSFANSGDPSSYTITFDLEADGNKDLIEYILVDEG